MVVIHAESSADYGLVSVSHQALQPVAGRFRGPCQRNTGRKICFGRWPQDGAMVRSSRQIKRNQRIEVGRDAGTHVGAADIKPIAQAERGGNFLAVGFPRGCLDSIAQAVIERKVRSDLPGILGIPFILVESEMSRDRSTLGNRRTCSVWIQVEVVLRIDF